LLSLNENRKLACSKYIIRSQIVENNTKNEILIRSDLNFCKRAQNIDTLKTIGTFTSDILKTNNIEPAKIAKQITFPPFPPWIYEKANIDIINLDVSKAKNPSFVEMETRIYIKEKYYIPALEIFTDGSVLDDGNAGSGFVIPSLDIKESYFLGNGYSIFTAELIAILKALQKIDNLSKEFISILFFVDSKSVLQAIQSSNHKERSDIILEIKHVIHCLKIRGMLINMCWIPSHCGFKFNDQADNAAKLGAKNINATTVNISLSKNEVYNLITNKINSLKSHDNILSNLANYYKIFSRHIISLAFRLYLNAWKTKYCKNVTCLCKNNISINHILKECTEIKKYLPPHVLNIDHNSITFRDWINISCYLFKSPFGLLL